MTEGKKKMSETLDWLIHIGIAVIIGVLIVTFVAQRTVVQQQSMQPLLYQGDNVIVEKISHKLFGLHRGDIIVLNAPEENRQLIKRVIALGGDEVIIKNDIVYVNGIVEDKLNPEGARTQSGENREYSDLTVPKGYVYVLGDNRENSRDSREFGPIKLSSVIGKAFLIFYPFNKIGFL